MNKNWTVDYFPTFCKHMLTLWINDKGYSMEISKETAEGLQRAENLETVVEIGITKEKEALRKEREGI